MTMPAAALEELRQIERLFERRGISPPDHATLPVDDGGARLSYGTVRRAIAALEAEVDDAGLG